MSYVAFDRKYRPTNFKSVIGQKFVIQTLMNSIKLDKIAHAYIFAGPKGIGKTTIARILAKAVNCQSSKDGDACNVCDSCKLINENHTTDIVELDAASNNGVDDIRTILSGAMTLPMNLKKKVYIIDEAHMLSTSAWNALLKTLEEAPKHVIFIFATTEMYKIPPTILSRCQVYQFSKLTSKELKDIVINTSFKENIKITDESVDKIVNLSDGSGRDAYSVLEQMATYTNNNVNIEDINKVFGLLDVDRKIEILNLIIKSDISEIMIKLDKYEENGVNFTLLASDIIKILLDKLVYLQTNDSKLLKVLNDKTINNIDLDNDKLVALISI
jgi:DNA polymerase-3 subunit gamma/tau